jgi:hypothetical protein
MLVVESSPATAIANTTPHSAAPIQWIRLGKEVEKEHGRFEAVDRFITWLLGIANRRVSNRLSGGCISAAAPCGRFIVAKPSRQASFPKSIKILRQPIDDNRSTALQ